MGQHIEASYFRPDRKGITVEADGIRFCTDQVGGTDCGVVLYKKEGQSLTVPFKNEGRRGKLLGVRIAINEPEQYRYQYYCKQETVTDRYAGLIAGNEEWGRPAGGSRCGGFYIDDFDWEDDCPPDISYEDSVIYGMNVRAFTMHRSSGVKHRGTFEGIVEKIPYLKKLGITAVELLPAYEFDECEQLPCPGTEAVKDIVNCWGFKEGFYYAPKTAYSAGKRPDHSFKMMVKKLHEAGLEVLMYFYFPVSFNRADILDILRYWTVEYHIDGIHLLGEDLPVTLITQDSLLSGSKILYHEYSYWVANPRYANTAVVMDHFRTQMRSLLKGDEDLTYALINHLRNKPLGRGTVNYMADYGGFSLFDMTAYDRKHNEENGENNRDGTDYNYSWNCGTEGISRKKNIQELRTKQIKNALSLIFLAQGTPFLFSGDELGNTRHGNNNAYCQDNDIGWIKWSPTVISKEIAAFARFLIDFRKAHPILRLPTEMQIMDTAKCGYPDVSYHGSEAWRPDLNPYSRSVGIMYCGKYAKRPDGTDDDFIYIAINLHWRPYELALPKLPKEKKWHLVKSTDLSVTEPEPANRDQHIIVKERSISIFVSKA